MQIVWNFKNGGKINMSEAVLEKAERRMSYHDSVEEMLLKYGKME